MIDAYKVAKKLIGAIYPVGDSSIDEIRFSNLQRTAELVDRFLIDMNNVVMDNKNAQEASRIRARKFVEEFFNRIGIKE